jgi:hypothetical protein
MQATAQRRFRLNRFWRVVVSNATSLMFAQAGYSRSSALICSIISAWSAGERCGISGGLLSVSGGSTAPTVEATAAFSCVCR